MAANANTRIMILRAGNGTRTRDPNLGKVVLYQLSYSRRFRLAVLEHSRETDTAARGPSFTLGGSATPTRARGEGKLRGDGGEGNRTPDLVNAIHALSQLSYAPEVGRG